MEFNTLLLEDDESTRRLMELLLGKRGHKVHSYPSPLHCPIYTEKAHQCHKSRPCFDFLISDNRMPGMSGLEFVQKQIEGGCQICLPRKAIISGNWLEEEIKLARRLGCQVFTKPVNLMSFYRWLDQAEQELYPSLGLSAPHF